MHKAGISIKEIARQLGISRNTVRATLRRDGPPEYERKPVPSKLDPHKDYLLERLREFPELSAKRLLDEVRARGYDGQISILKDFTRPYRVPRKRTVVRFDFKAPARSGDRDLDLDDSAHDQGGLLDNLRALELGRNDGRKENDPSYDDNNC